MGYLWCVTGSSVGVLAVLLPALLLLLPGEHADYWLVWPGVALMLGAVLGCGVGLRRGGYRGAGVTSPVFGAVLAGLYYAVVFVSDNEGVAMVGCSSYQSSLPCCRRSPG